MKKQIRSGCIGAGLLFLFVLWTVALGFVDVKAIGPNSSKVGFATVNAFIHSVTGVHLPLYTLTDWLGLVPICLMFGFAVLGLLQWIKRKSLQKVDRSLLLLGGFYVVVTAVYLLFESFVVNYRPILINGRLEASYPSSTTMLVLCVMPTALMQFNERIQNAKYRQVTKFMVTGRLLSGVHWFSDIIGGTLLSGGFVTLYHSFKNKVARN